MSVLVFPVGISGSGKSHFFKKLNSTLYLDGGKQLSLVEPDLIRKKLTGSISDQSKNAEVFDEAKRMTISHLSNDRNVYFSATNLGMKNLLQSIEFYTSKFNELHIMIVYLTDSEDIKKCHGRVVKDFDDGIDRSDTRDISIIERQYDKYIQMTSDKFKPRDLYPENVSVFEYSDGIQIMDDIVSRIVRLID